ncbi:MAG: hypothetical protein AAFP90_07395 [Planctomycetota bacterium]
MRSPHFIATVSVALLLLVAVLSMSNGINAETTYGSMTPQQLAQRIERQWPRELRSRNRDSGSCVFVSTETLARTMGNDRLADYISRNFRGGEYASRMNRKLDRLNVRYAMTDQGDSQFLDWALGNTTGAKRGACITLKGPHMLNLVHLDPPGTPGARAIIIDNNFPNRQETWTRDRLIRDWRRRGGWAFTIFDGSPPPPRPRF